MSPLPPAAPLATDDPGPGVLEQFEARKLLEPELAALAARRMNEAAIDALVAAVDRAEAAFLRGEPAEADDHAFHVGLAEASGNFVLAAVVRQLWDLRRHRMWDMIRARVVTQADRMQVVADRRAIVSALRRRDAGGTKLAMRRYMANAERRYFG